MRPAYRTYLGRDVTSARARDHLHAREVRAYECRRICQSATARSVCETSPLSLGVYTRPRDKSLVRASERDACTLHVRRVACLPLFLRIFLLGSPNLLSVRDRARHSRAILTRESHYFSPPRSRSCPLTLPFIIGTIPPVFPIRPFSPPHKEGNLIALLYIGARFRDTRDSSSS